MSTVKGYKTILTVLQGQRSADRNKGKAWVYHQLSTLTVFCLSFVVATLNAQLVRHCNVGWCDQRSFVNEHKDAHSKKKTSEYDTLVWFIVHSAGFTWVYAI